MKGLKEFPFSQARRISEKEIKSARKAIEDHTGQKRISRGRPPKLEIEKYKPISIRIHPNVLIWAKREAKRRGLGYQTIINEALLKKVA